MPLVASIFKPDPVAKTKPVNGADSAPNFNLFNNFLVASACGSASTSLFNSVGPASKASPIVPISSTSPTKVSPAAPPKAIAPIFLPVDSSNCFAFFKPFCKLFALGFKYLPALLALTAFDARVVAIFAPAAPGTPICTKASTNLPAAASCAFSSNIFILSKACSTLAAASVVIPVASISSAPKDTIPSGTLIIPDAIPAIAELI